MAGIKGVSLALRTLADVADADTGKLRLTSDVGTSRLATVDAAGDAEIYATQTDLQTATTGLWNDRGNYDASSNLYPSSGGSGTAGAILKGNIWTISVAGTLGGKAVAPGDTVRALVDTPGQTSANWAQAETNLGYAPLNPANNLSDVASVPTSRTNLGGTTVGQNLFTLTNPSAVTFPQFNADNTVTAQDAATHRTALGLGTGNSPTFTGLTLSASATFAGFTSSDVAVIDVSSASPALRLTQRGSGHVILMEDDTTPDATPWALSATGMQFVGDTTARNVAGSQGLPLYQQYASSGAAGLSLSRFSANNGAAGLFVSKSRATSPTGSPAIVNDLDLVFSLRCGADDGTDLETTGAVYTVQVDGTPASNVTPMRHLWQTMNSGGTLATRMSLSAAGLLNIASTQASTSTTTGALTVAGGTGIAGAVFAGGAINTTATTASTSATTGALISGGGLGVAGDAWIGGKAALKTSDALVTVHGAMGATETFDASASDIHSGTLDAACTFTLSNPSATGRQTTLVLYILQDGTGGWAITWPASVKADPAAPAIITTANTTSIFALTTINGGTTWYRSLVATGIA